MQRGFRTRAWLALRNIARAHQQGRWIHYYYGGVWLFAATRLYQSVDRGGVDEFEFFGVELVEKASVAEVEAAAWLAIFAAALRAIVKTPARGAAINRAAQIG